MSAATSFLIFRKTGWIGQQLGELLQSMGEKYEYASARLEDCRGVLEDIERVKPTHVLNAAGLTGRPNVDWCESHRVETIRANVVGCLTLADVCLTKDIHVTYYGTGCIFQYDEQFPLGSGKGFKEADRANFVGSFYSFTKSIVEDLLKAYPNMLTLRVRMPIVADLEHPRNFITKIKNYERVVDIPNSMTVLPELLPYSVEMAKRELTGVMNFTNPGCISHNEILELYKPYVDPGFTWQNFTVEEQAKVIVAPRSNNLLDTTRIQAEFLGILPIKESLLKFVFGPHKKNTNNIIESL